MWKWKSISSLPFLAQLSLRWHKTHCQLPSLIRSSLWQAAPWALSEHCSSGGPARSFKSTPHTYPSFEMASLRANILLHRRAQLSSPCGIFMLKTTVSCTMRGAHKFFSTWFAAEQTCPNTHVPFERCSQIYGFCCSQMLPFYFIICTFCVLVFSRRNGLSLIVENCTLLHKDKCWSTCTVPKSTSGKKLWCGYTPVAAPRYSIMLIA